MLWHVFVIVAVWGLTVTWLNRPQIRFESFSPKQTVAYYPVSDYLPPVGNPIPPAEIEKKGEPEFSRQPIISLPKLPNNTTQTIVDPSTVKILAKDARLPNLVAWNNIPAAPVAAGTRSASQLTLPWQTPAPVAPVAENADRRISELATRAPAPFVVQPAPTDETAQRKLGDLDIAQTPPSVAPPKLETAAQKALASGALAKPEAPAPPDLQGVAATGANAARQLIVLNVRPQDPVESIQAPGGNRSGSFAATPEGKPGAPGTPDIIGGGQSANGGGSGRGTPSSAPAGVYVGPPPAQMSNTAGKSSLSSDQQKKILMAGMLHPVPLAGANSIRSTPPVIDAPRREQIEDQVFGSKRYYSMILNMPNLTSGGGSWILRYAELKQDVQNGELSAPVAMQKTDPAYPAELIREGVEGTVVLYAIIHSDGHVSDVRVLRSVDARLDANARAALTQWRFRPATKAGAAIALETVVHIPFALPKNGF